ncbi:MAG: hypothetical protein K6C94_03035 [Candidatus Gastranaerophilales bacterium]|nr:hypothetical protein [Candidatus Gastranaerophilales bacterium]
MKIRHQEMTNDINLDFTDDISVDFEEVDNIALQDIRKISDIHKAAVLNGKKLYIKNAAPEILNILAITGLHKSFKNFDEQYSAPDKRKRGF